MTSEHEFNEFDSRLISADQVQTAKSLMEALEMGLAINFDRLKFPSWAFVDGSLWNPVLKKLEQSLEGSRGDIYQTLNLLLQLFHAYETLSVQFCGWGALMSLLEGYSDLSIPLLVTKILKMHPHFGKRRRTPLSGGRIGNIFPSTRHGIASFAGVGVGLLNVKADFRDVTFNKKDEDTLKRALSVFVQESHSIVFNPAFDVFTIAAKDVELPMPVSEFNVTYMTTSKTFVTVQVSTSIIRNFAGTRSEVQTVFPGAAEHEISRLTFRLWLAVSLDDEGLRDCILELSFGALEILTINFHQELLDLFSRYLAFHIKVEICISHHSK